MYRAEGLDLSFSKYCRILEFFRSVSNLRQVHENLIFFVNYCSTEIDSQISLHIYMWQIYRYVIYYRTPHFVSTYLICIIWSFPPIFCEYRNNPQKYFKKKKNLSTISDFSKYYESLNSMQQFTLAYGNATPSSNPSIKLKIFFKNIKSL